MAPAHRDPFDPVDAKRLRKEGKRLASQLAAESAVAEANPAEAKRLRKLAKKVTKATAAANAEAKRLRKAASSVTNEGKAAEDEDEGVPVSGTALEPEAEVGQAGESAPLDQAAGSANRVQPSDGGASADVSEPLDLAAVEAKRLKVEKRARLRANKNKIAAPDALEPRKAKRDSGNQGEESSQSKKSKPTCGEGPSKEIVHKFGDEFKVFVRGLPWSIDEEALRAHFDKCGGIEDLKMPKTPSGSSRGVGFIKFRTQEGFDAALDLNDTECGGRNMNVEKVQKREGKGQGKEATSLPKPVSNELTVFIRGLPFSANENQLRKDFEECGAIEKVTLPMNAEGKPKGICFIKFLDPAGLEAALKFDNTGYGGRTINVHTAQDGKGNKSKDGKGRGKDGKTKGKDTEAKGKGDAKHGKDDKCKDGKGASNPLAAKVKRLTACDSDDESN